MAEPLVSIVMPTFNRLECLQATLESVFSQTMTNWELIIADDGSGAQTVDYLRRFEDDERVRLLWLEHSGNPGKARNAGIASACAPYIAFLDSDDLWEPEKLERQLAALRSAVNNRWSYTAFTIVDGDGIPLASEQNRRWIPHGGSIFTEVVRSLASIRTPTVLACTRLVHEAGAFDEAIDCAEDYDLWMRLALLSPACVVDDSLVRVRRHDGNRKTEVSRPYLARDYSLRKLALRLKGARRALVKQERSRNFLNLATATAAFDGRYQALVIVGKSLAVGWKYPRWWYGAAKTALRVCFQ